MCVYCELTILCVYCELTILAQDCKSDMKKLSYSKYYHKKATELRAAGEADADKVKDCDLQLLMLVFTIVHAFAFTMQC